MQVNSETVQVEVDAVEVISREEQGYCGWPSLLRCRDGALLVVCSGGRQHHVCPFGQVHLLKSYDQGKSWHRHRVLADGPLDDRDAGLLETAQGTLIANWFTSLTWEHLIDHAHPQDQPQFLGHSEAERREWLERKAALTDAVRFGELGAWVIRSTDRGQTWSAKIDSVANSPHGPMQLANGDLLYPGVMRVQGRVGRVGSPFGERVGAALSQDDGRTWQWLADIPGGPDHTPGTDFHELHGVQAADGRVVVHIRNHGQAHRGEVLQTESFDMGRTWSDPHPIGVWGYPAHLLRTADDTLLTTVGHRRDPLGIQIATSRDHGETWSQPIALITDSAGDLGYPSTTELEPGRFLTVWYDQAPARKVTCLRQAHWRLPQPA